MKNDDELSDNILTLIRLLVSFYSLQEIKYKKKKKRKHKNKHRQVQSILQ